MEKTKEQEQNQHTLIPIFTVIKFQAIIRGFLARRRVKKIYGYEMTHGLMNRGNNQVEMDPEKLEEQRARVQAIREQLPEFEYGTFAKEDEDDKEGVKKESRPMQ